MASRLHPDDQDTDDGSEAFALLGSETRLSVLRVLWEQPGEPMAFSELRERVGMRDSGQFNYHLNKLVGRFIDRTDDGYQLKTAGIWVMGALQAGAYEAKSLGEPIPIDDPCPACGGPLLARYEDERMTITCESCETVEAGSSVLPGALSGYDVEEYPAVFDRWIRMLLDRVHSGFCIACAGRVETAVEVVPDDAIDHDGPLVVHRCVRCPEMVYESVGESLLTHPAVVAFYHDHGIDIRTKPLWTFGWTKDATVESTDPVRVHVTVALEGETLTLVVDGEAAVIAEDRS